MSTEPNRPIRIFRLRGVKAAVFENKGDQGVFHKVTLQRIYREGEQWKTTQSLGRDDLPVAILLLDRAWQFILEIESGTNRDESHADASRSWSETTTDVSGETIGVGPPSSQSPPPIRTGTVTRSTNTARRRVTGESPAD